MIRIKLYDNILSGKRRFSMEEETSWEQFQTKLFQMFNTTSLAAYRIEYRDDENDWIQVSNQEEWHEAVQVYNSQKEANKNAVLNLRRRSLQNEDKCQLVCQFLQSKCEEWRNCKQQHQQPRGRHCGGFKFKILGGVLAFFLLPCWLFQIAFFVMAAFKVAKFIKHCQGGRQCTRLQCHGTSTTQPQQTQEPRLNSELPKQQQSSKENLLYPSAPIEEEVHEEDGKYRTNLELLQQMGFNNAKLNKHLLKHFDNDLQKVLNSLVQMKSF